MSINRRREHELLRQGISLPDSENDSKKIFFINGLPGCGKSEFTAKLAKELIEKQAVDALMYFRGNDFPKYTPEIIARMMAEISTSEDFEVELPDSETAYIKSRYIAVLEKIKIVDTDLYSRIENKCRNKSDYELAFEDKKSGDEYDYDKKLSAALNKKQEIQLVLDPIPFISEALIVDLMNRFYPLDEQTGYELYNDTEPRKVALVIDDCDKYSAATNDLFFDQFCEFLDTKTFGDFKIYTISKIDSEIKISAFFDFRVIYAVRGEMNPDSDGFLKRYENKTAGIQLNPYSADDLKSLSREHHIDLDFLNKVAEYSSSAPSAIHAYFTEAGVKIKIIDDKLIKKILENLVFKGLFDEEIELLKRVAFAEDFQSPLLKCYNISDPNPIFDYLTSRNDFFFKSGSFGRIKMKPELRNIIQNIVIKEDKISADGYKACAKIYASAADVFDGLSLREPEIVMNLAYFKRFNSDYALDEAFLADADSVRKFVDTHPYLFDNGIHTQSLKESIRTQLKAINKLVDKEKYDEKFKLAAHTWQKFEDQTINKIETDEAEAKILQEESDELYQNIQENKLNTEIAQSSFFEAENGLVDLHKKQTMFEADPKTTAAIVNISAGAAGFLATYTLPFFFSDYFTPENFLGTTFLFILYLVFTVLAVSGIITLTKILKLRQQKKKMKVVDDIVVELEARKAAYATEMKTLKDACSSMQTDFDERKVKLNKLTLEIKTKKEQLEEPFMD
ncbi:MAG: hypothetical protein PF588_01835 [Candidatus Kapabacteria bacterium]|jgi:hypothetical protein|nr:hypothetical protein [Candidatus Kapabacteria bacterium]